MTYKTSKKGENYINKLASHGEDAFVKPSYKPFLERPVTFLSFLCLFGSIPAFYFLGVVPGFILIGAFLFLYSVKELFIQDDHALIRIYGPVGRARYIVEDLVRDKYLQYFNETNTDGRPIPKIVRDYIYQKAHGVKALTSFGTELDINDSDNTTYNRVLHRNFPGTSNQKSSYEVIVGEHREGVKPFKIKSTLNISAMSYGALNYKACEAMSIGSKDVCYVNTGEGGYGPHGVAGNDIVFQIGTGKFGCGNEITLPDGSKARVLDDEHLKELVKQHDNIRMIQLKISQGAKPGLGGHLPAPKNTPEIAAVRKVKPHTTLVSPSQHYETMGRTPEETINKLIDFIQHVRKITELPVGIKMCIGRLEEIDLLVDAMVARKDGPDSIQIDGADGGTGAAPNVFVNYVGYGGTVETTCYLDQKLKKAGIRDKVVISSSGRIFTPGHAAIAFAYGADVVETARGAMLALGCIQSLHCHSGNCPTGIATHSKWRMRGLVIPEKSTRIHMYFKGFHKDMMELTHVLGHSDPRDITPDDIRTVTYKQQFENHLSEDPFGFNLPSVEKLTAL